MYPLAKIGTKEEKEYARKKTKSSDNLLFCLSLNEKKLFRRKVNSIATNPEKIAE